MAAEEEKAPRASPESEGEKPVRERLQRASIDANAQLDAAINVASSVATAESAEALEDTKTEESPSAIKDVEKNDALPASNRGRPQRKRSFDEVESSAPKQSQSTHGRKRSRESTTADDDNDTGSSSPKTSGEHTRPGSEGESAVNGDHTGSSVASRETSPITGATGHTSSPKSKRSKVESKGTDEESKKTVVDPKRAPNGAKHEGDKDNKDPSGVATTDTPQTSSSAFASSGFGAFASSSTSGFGSISSETKKLSSFASPEPQDKPKEAGKTSSTFGGTLGQSSGFGSGTGSAFGGGSSSGFGGGGSGFGSAFGGGSGFGSAFASGGGAKLSSFASGGSTLGGAKKPVRTFGAPTADDEDGSDDDKEAEDGDKIKSPANDTDEKQDQRFFAQDLETGEEHERTEYTCRAKLYNFVQTNPADPTSKKEWKERGLGTLRLNVVNSSTTPKDDVEAGAGDKEGARARLVMRAEGSHRVILNTPIQKQLLFGSVSGEAPQNGYIHFMGSIDNQAKLELLQLKMRQQFAGELYEHIEELKKNM